MVIGGFILFLFIVYLLSRDDFVFLRKNVTLDQLFDTVFLSSIAALLFSRIVFVALHFKHAYFNPLVFFLIPYFPGLSLSGALIGGTLFTILYVHYYKNPTARVLDIFSIAFLFSFALIEGISGAILLIHKSIFSGGIEMGFSFFVLLTAFIANRFFTSTFWRDGGVSLFCLFSLSLLTICSKLLTTSLAKHFVFDYEIIIFLAFIVILFGAWLLRLKARR